ncbi:MAG: hypothetical protein WCP20_12745, partial [Desulfuromonadales bacterium]
MHVENCCGAVRSSSGSCTFVPVLRSVFLVRAFVTSILLATVIAAPYVAFADTITDPTTGMVLVKVTGGTYTMGDTFNDGNSDEKPTHQVT